MKRSAIFKARDHLEQAKAALAQMSLDNGIKAYERAWSDFLLQANRIHAKLEQGSKGCSASGAWFGRKKHERKMDQLLSYLLHARNCDEHSIDYVTCVAADGVAAHFTPTNAVSVGFEMMIDGEGTHFRNVQVNSPDGGVDRVEYTNPKMELAVVRDRGRHYHPPKMHMDRPIVDGSPRGVASLAVTYLEDMLREASELPTVT